MIDLHSLVVIYKNYQSNFLQWRDSNTIYELSVVFSEVWSNGNWCIFSYRFISNRHRNFSVTRIVFSLKWLELIFSDSDIFENRIRCDLNRKMNWKNSKAKLELRWWELTGVSRAQRAVSQGLTTRDCNVTIRCRCCQGLTRLLDARTDVV